MKTVLLGIIATVLLGAPGVAHAQDRVRLEFAPGVLFATEEFADSDLGTGFGAGVNLSVRVLPRLAPYVGWDWRHLQADTLFAGSDIDVEETGYAFSVRYEHPIAVPEAGFALTLVVRGAGAVIVTLDDSTLALPEILDFVVPPRPPDTMPSPLYRRESTDVRRRVTL